MRLFFIVMSFVCCNPSMAQVPDANGQVTLPLEQYQQLLTNASEAPLSAPSSYALGDAALDIDFSEHDGRVTATVRAQIQLEAFENQWTLVQILRPGAALKSATLNGSPVQLVQRNDGFFWLSDTRQKATLELVYLADAHHADRAYITSLPVPQAAAIRFELNIPQRDIDLSVAPAMDLSKADHANGTRASGTLPATPAVMISWRIAQKNAVTISRAQYQGELSGEAVRWTVDYVAESSTDGETSLSLLATDVTLIDLTVDGKAARVTIEDQRFAIQLAGAGIRQIQATFEAPVSYPDGVPTTTFVMPGVPVSSFVLTLPGEKQLRVNPTANVLTTLQDDVTEASFHMPLGQSLQLSWMEAIPQDVAVALRANAGVYQAVHAEEGVLYGRATIAYEITRGEANALSFRLPLAAQVNQVTSPSAAIADWILEPGEPNNQVRVFLNRPVSGEFALHVAYEQLLDQGQTRLDVPLLLADGVARQKGMLALLSGSDLALAPQETSAMSEVGENQLPAFFRNQFKDTVSHTYKYHSGDAALVVNAVTPERLQGKFNAQIDTLISIGEVTLKGAVSILADVKSGVLGDLEIRLPANINVLGVSGPSIRNHQINSSADQQTVAIEFTQDMDGQFRLELNYERIMVDESAETIVPRIEVVGADVEHGRIAIEALAALEVQASQVAQLSSLEINELPRQLVLKTTNPILLAYKYVKTDEPIALSLKITRHEEIDVQVATIDTAKYKTLFTRDGLAVTSAKFDVRNSRRQFLRLSLPQESSIWSVFVNGHAQKPAFATESGPGSRDVLIKMINSANAFPVELIYATKARAMKSFGRVSSRLPRPDMIVTHTNWDVYVPQGPSYRSPATNMDLTGSQRLTTMREASRELVGASANNMMNGQPLQLLVPLQGITYSFSKLYANQSPEDAQFSIAYVHSGANQLGLVISLLAAALIWLAIVALYRGSSTGRRYAPYALLATGVLLLLVAIVILDANIIPAAGLALLIGAMLGAAMVWRRFTAA